MTDKEDQFALFKGGETTSVARKQLHAHVNIKLDPYNYTDILYQHSVLCQTSLPYRDQKDKNVWQRRQGNAQLIIQTHKVPSLMDDGTLIDYGLPFGPKARLILFKINSVAMKMKQNGVAIVETRLITLCHLI